MPLCGAVTKLTGLSPDANGCTLRAPAVAAIPYRLGARQGWDGLEAKRIAKKLGRGRLASMYADATVVG